MPVPYSPFEYPPARYTCAPGHTCPACINARHRRQHIAAEAERSTPDAIRTYEIVTRTWTGLVQVNRQDTIVAYPATMPQETRQCKTWQALRRRLQQRYTTVQITRQSGRP